jgi:AcrR family transcriptional regulator
MASRDNQKERTRKALVTAALELVAADRELTMPTVAAGAKVSEATAYRYFPDLVSLIRASLGELEPGIRVDFAGITDPVERVGFAAETHARHVLKHQKTIRAAVAATFARDDEPPLPAGHRIALIEEATLPLVATTDPEALKQLRNELCVVISAESAFTLVDLCRLDPDEAVATLVRTARTLTAAFVAPGRS